MKPMNQKNEWQQSNHHVFLQQPIADRLICPVCKQKVLYDDMEIKCTNVECGIKFPIIDNIPILINEKNSVFSINDYVISNKNTFSSQSKIKKTIRKIVKYFPSLSNNLSSKDNFKLLNKLLSNKNRSKILIIGGGTITTDTEMIFAAENMVVESDVYVGPRTQIIIDSHDIPFKNETFDLIIFQAVLEHVADPYRCVEEAYRVLTTDGIVLATTPFMQQVHMGAYDFTRFTYLGHRRLFRKFDEIDSGVFAGTGVALGWSIKYFISSLFNNKYIRLFFQLLTSFIFFWLKYIDFFIRNNKGIYNGASGFYFIGRKSNNILSDKDLIAFFRGF